MPHSLRHKLLAGLAAAVAAGALAQTCAFAQADGGDTVMRCRSLSTDAAQIACLEQALLNAPPATPATAASSAPPQTDSLERRGFRLPGVPFIGGDRDGGSEGRLVTSDSPEAGEFGAQQVAARRGEFAPVDRLSASVTSAREVPYKRLEVVLDNGQVWRQIATDQPWDSARYDEPEQVEIWASRTGGYRLSIADTNLTLRVERVE